MKSRVLTAIIAGPIFVGLLLVAEPVCGLLCLILPLLGVGEMRRAFRSANRPANRIAAYGGPALAFAWWADARLGLPIGAHLRELFVIAGILVIVTELWTASKTEHARTGESMANGLLIGLYTSLFFGIAWARQGEAQLGTGPLPHLSAGGSVICVLLAGVWATDSFAYFVGRALGKHKLAPRVSPGKTWEGAIGGMIFGTIGACLMAGWLRGAWTEGAWIGLIAGTLGQMGDLLESALKRDVGVKDFGGLLPGHGGVLDRFDSLLIVAPVVVALQLLR